MLLLKPLQQEVTNYIQLRDTYRFDRVVPSADLSSTVAVPDPQADGVHVVEYVDGRHPNYKVDFTSSALAQVLSRMKVPAEFYNRCPPFLKVPMFNHFNGQHGGHYLFRMDPKAPAGETEIQECRAVLSSKYGVVNDSQVLGEVFSVLEGQDPKPLYRVFEDDEHITRLVVEFPDTNVTHNGVSYVAGLSVVNSETGHSSVWIEPVVHTVGTSFVNRKTLKTQGVDCRIVHRGEINPIRIRAMVEQSKRIAQVGLVQLIESMENTISTDHALRYAKSIDSLPKRLYDILTDEWNDIQDLKRFEAARRIIQLAQELPLFKRINVEQETGKMVGLFNNYRARMDAIMDEIGN